jgi:hypothetical protein
MPTTMEFHEERVQYFSLFWHLNNSIKSDGDTLQYLKVEKDSAFKCLVPHLYFPERDVPSLYRFRNNGCTIFTNGKSRNKDK